MWRQTLMVLVLCMVAGNLQAGDLQAGTQAGSRFGSSAGVRTDAQAGAQKDGQTNAKTNAKAGVQTAAQTAAQADAQAGAQADGRKRLQGDEEGRQVIARPLCTDARPVPGQISRPVFRWQDETGAVHYTECPPANYVSEKLDMLVLDDHTSSRAKASAGSVASSSSKSSASASSKSTTKRSTSSRSKKSSQPSGAALKRQLLARQARCNEARAKIRRIEDQFRRGYTTKQGERLRERHRQWSAVSRDNCSPP